MCDINLINEPGVSQIFSRNTVSRIQSSISSTGNQMGDSFYKPATFLLVQINRCST
jgi:hypothetical protein